jgi:hypothetical protein
VRQLFRSIGVTSEIDNVGSKMTEPFARVESLSNEQNCFECTTRVLVDRIIHIVRVEPRLSRSETLLVRTENTNEHRSDGRPMFSTNFS